RHPERRRHAKGPDPWPPRQPMRLAGHGVREGHSKGIAACLNVKQVAHQEGKMPRPRVVWSQSLPGQQPGVLLGQNKVLLHYQASRGKQKVFNLVCYDFDGLKQWSQAHWQGLLALAEDHFLVMTSERSPAVINGNGAMLHRGRFGPV